MEMVLKALRTERIWEGKRGAWDRGWRHPHSSGRRRGGPVSEKWQGRRAWLFTTFDVTDAGRAGGPGKASAARPAGFQERGEEIRVHCVK